MNKLEFNDLMAKTIVYMITNNYCEGKDNILNVIEKFREYTTEFEISKSYEECIAVACTRIEILSDLLLMKKLKNNREDLNSLIEVLEEETKNLKHIAKEVK